MTESSVVDAFAGVAAQAVRAFAGRNAYVRGYTAQLKHALDDLHHEWQYKPVGFVSYA